MTKQCSINDYHSKRKVITVLTSLILSSGALFAQAPLDTYIEEGLINNEGIRQNNIRLQKNINALKEAKALFFPSFSVGGSYLHADGGRMIDLAIGDMLNPVYSTLNELTGSQQFQDIENMHVQMNPENFYDARIRLMIPLFDAEIFYNHKMRKQLVDIQEIETTIYKRELVKEIKTAYYLYCQASGSVLIRENGLELAKENYRINESLLKNDKGTQANLLRSKNEITKAEEALFSAQKGVKDSQSYFNFLLNKPFGSEIIIEEEIFLPILTTHENTTQREEIQQIDITSDIFRINKQLARSYLLPKVGGFLDLGSQSEDWKFNNTSRYYMVGVSLEWTFSLAGRNLHKVRQATNRLEIIESETRQLKNRLDLQLDHAKNGYEEALNSYKATQSQYQVVKKYYHDITKAYKEGQALYIELLEAQHHYTDTELLLNINLYNVHIRYAEKERADASFIITN